MGLLRRWLIMTVLGLSGGIIFSLPYLKEIFYRPLADALGLSNTQVGLMMSAFGVTALICYFPGGWIADRFSARKLITLSMVSTGLLGFYFATFPGFLASVVVHAVWGVTITLLFWASMIRVTRGWAPPDEQGSAFGILETMRGVVELGVSALLLGVFIWLGSTDRALSAAINQLSGMIVAIGILAWFVIEDTVQDSVDGDDHKVGLHEVLTVLKMPVVWLIALVLLSTNAAYNASYYFGSFATDVFKTTVGFAGIVGVGRMLLKPGAALIAGFVSDRFGVARSASVLLLVLMTGMFAFTLIPPDAGALTLVLVNVGVVMIAIYALRGIYFALLEEGKVPRALTGTAGGIVSAVAFTTDAYMPALTGVLLDSFPGVTGFRYVFLVTAATCALGFTAAVLIARRAGRPAN